MMSMTGIWEIEYYTVPLSDEEQARSATGAERVAFADETPKKLLGHIRAVREYELALRRKVMAGWSSVETYEHTLIRRHRPKGYNGPDLRYKAFMEPVYVDDWEKYPPVSLEDIGVPFAQSGFVLNPAIIPCGVKFVCFLDETPEEFLPIIRKFPNVEFKASRDPDKK